MTKTLFQKYFTDSFFLNAPLVINAAIALVTLPIILANLPIADYGKWQFVLSFQVWVIVFSGTNITFASKRGIAKGLDGTFIYAFLKRFKLFFCISSLILFVAFYFKFSGNLIFSYLITIIGLYLIFGYLFQISFLQFLIAKKRFKEWSIWQILISSVSLIGSAIIASLTKNIVYFALFQLGSITILSWIGWFWIVKKEKLIESYKRGEIDKECVPYGLKLIPVDLVTVTSGKLSHFIIGPFFGFSNLAIFSVANKLRDAIANLIKSARPLLYTDFARKGKEELIRIVNPYLIKIGMVGAGVVAISIVAGWIYIQFLLPPSFHQAIVYFCILTLGLPAGVITIILHTVLESHLRHKELTIANIIPNLIKIILILALGYWGKIIGVCLALTISMWISFIFYYIVIFKPTFLLIKP